MGVAAITEKARAKINLYLDVTGEKNGMHTLQSIVKFLPIANTVTIKKRIGLRLEFRNPIENLKTEETNACKAAKTIIDTYDLPGAEIFIEEDIPAKEGLGGSSATAAAIAKGLQKLYELPEFGREFLVKLGGDVPCQYLDCDCLMTGTGENITPVTLPKTDIVLLLGAGGVSTKEVFALYDTLGGGDKGIPDAELIKMYAEGKKSPFNALAEASTRLNPAVKSNLERLKNSGFSRCGMTGSGSGVFAIGEGEGFENALCKLIDIYGERDITVVRNI